MKYAINVTIFQTYQIVVEGKDKKDAKQKACTAILTDPKQGNVIAEGTQTDFVTYIQH